MHLGQWCHLAGVTEVVGIFAARERRAGCRLDSDDTRLRTAAQAGADVRKGDAGKVGTAAGAADDHVGIGISHGHLLHRLNADDGLVHQHVVQH